MVQGCTHTNQTFWTEVQFVVTTSPGIRDRDTRVAEVVVRELQKDKPESSMTLFSKSYDHTLTHHTRKPLVFLP
jgi:hypothetical protein